MRRIVPYEGSEPYIFISYAHKDPDRVLPIVSELQARSYRIWYDEGITPGKEWDAVISAHIKNCTFFLALISENYLASENCKDELNWVRELGKPRLLVYLEEAPLPDAMAMRLGRSQAIKQYAYADQSLFYEKLATADGINDCREESAVEVERLARLSGQGDPEAQDELGKRYYNGHGAPQNYKKAVEWYTKAAEQGYAAAQNDLGCCYYSGLGVPQNYEEAVAWFSKAAKQGDAKAQCSLGCCYDAGVGVPQNDRKAVEWYTRAAEQGLDAGQYCLGICYSDGRGVQQNYEKAAEWYTKAAEQGYAAAQYRLGACYFGGLGVPFDNKKAAAWFTKTAEQGDAAAQTMLRLL